MKTEFYGNIQLGTIEYSEYANIRNKRFSVDTLKFDDPDRPIPTEEQELIWWKKQVLSNSHIVMAIKLNTITIGLVNAFSFNESKDTCEIGIELYNNVQLNKGIGTLALTLFINYLKNNMSINNIKAETNSKNIAAIRVLEKIDFIMENEKIEGSIKWKCFEKIILNSNI